MFYSKKPCKILHSFLNINRSHNNWFYYFIIDKFTLQNGVLLSFASPGTLAGCYFFGILLIESLSDPEMALHLLLETQTQL